MPVALRYADLVAGPMPRNREEAERPAPQTTWVPDTCGALRKILLPLHFSLEPAQARCNAIARKLNDRPRKRHGFRTPAELFEKYYDVALRS
jgi:hypothetical protein